MDRGQTEAAVSRLCREVGREAAQLMAEGRMLCAPAVLTVLNRRLGGGLGPEEAAGLAAALPEGLGGAGCLCGAVSGACLALGLFLGQGGRRAQQRTRTLARRLHQDFIRVHGATCCRELRRRAGKGRRALREHCARLTGQAAELACALILSQRPELLSAAASLPPGHSRRGLRAWADRVAAFMGLRRSPSPTPGGAGPRA